MKYRHYFLSDLVTIKYGKNQKKVVSEYGNVPIYGTGGLMGYATDFLYDKPSVLIGRKGTISKVKYVEQPFWTVDTLFYTVINTDLVIPKYLYYVMLQLDLNNYNEGTTIPSLRRETLYNLEFDIPPIDEQKKIISCLKPLEEKIVNNNEINNNLEQQVTTAFYNMFGKYEQNSNTHKPLSTIAKFKYGTMPKKDKLGTGHYHAFSGYQIVGTYPEVMFDNPQLIIVARGVGGCGDVKYTPANCYLTNLSIAIITEKTMHDDYLYHYLRLHDTKIMNTGSAQPQITVATLKKFKIPIPPEEEMLRFSDFVQPFKQQYRNNQDENKLLSKLRDALLPKLMSGELDVSDIDL